MRFLGKISSEMKLFGVIAVAVHRNMKCLISTILFFGILLVLMTKNGIISGYLILNIVPIQKELCKGDEPKLKEKMQNYEQKVPL